MTLSCVCASLAGGHPTLIAACRWLQLVSFPLQRARKTKTRRCRASQQHQGLERYLRCSSVHERGSCKSLTLAEAEVLFQMPTMKLGEPVSHVTGMLRTTLQRLSDHATCIFCSMMDAAMSSTCDSLELSGPAADRHVRSRELTLAASR